MISVLGRSDDDPPIFALALTGDDAGRQLDAWLADSSDVHRVELHLGVGAVMTATELERIATRYETAIQVVGGGEGLAHPVAGA